MLPSGSKASIGKLTEQAKTWLTYFGSRLSTLARACLITSRPPVSAYLHVLVLLRTCLPDFE